MWTALATLAATPPLALIAGIRWRSPLPLSETVALLEDVTRRTPASFFIPDTPYYRPLFHATLGAIWNSGLSLGTRLDAIHLLQIVPVLALVLGFIVWIRPRHAAAFAAAVVAIAVLLGIPALRDNMELPLSYTTIGMPLGLLVWALLNAERQRPWHAPAIVALVAAALLTRAPGATRTVGLWIGAMAAGYVAMRLLWHARLPVFEQAVGLGFHEIEPREAVARYGGFPYFVYA